MRNKPWLSLFATVLLAAALLVPMTGCSGFVGNLADILDDAAEELDDLARELDDDDDDLGDLFNDVEDFFEDLFD